MDIDEALNISDGLRLALSGVVSGGFFLFPGNRARIAHLAQRQEEIVSVLCVLPGTHRYQDVEAALAAAAVEPHDLYVDLATGVPTDAVKRFTFALTYLERRPEEPETSH